MLLIQDPAEDLRTGRRRIRGFECFLPPHEAGVSRTRSTGPLVAILVRTSIPVRPLTSGHCRVHGVVVSTRRGPLALISAYIHFLHGEGLEALSSIITAARQLTPLLFIGADCNGHSSWWGPPDQVTNAIGELMEDLILRHGLAVENTWPCEATFRSERNFESWIDVTLTSPSLSRLVRDWRLALAPDLASDHAAISCTLQLETVLEAETRLDWRKVSWDSFRPALRQSLEALVPPSLPVSCPTDVNTYASALSAAFDTAVHSHVPLRRICGPSSHPWWSPQLAQLHSALTRARRRWARTRARSDKRVANACKRALRRAIQEAKRESWRTFCENTSGSDLWSAFERVARPPQRGRIPTLVVEGQHISDTSGQAQALAN